MTSSGLSRSHPAYAGLKLQRAGAIVAVAAMIGALFAGSTVVTPLYIMYKQAFGFSQISLTLIYAAYVIGNLCALLLFGRLSDQVGRRPMAMTGMALAIISAMVFLFARGIAWLYCGRIMSGLAIGIGAGTGTAWLAELIREESKARATVIATASNFVGLGIGALGAGLLAEYAKWPLRLPFVVYLVALVAVTVVMWLAPETVARPHWSMKDISIRPRVLVPPEIRAKFVAPAVTGFGSMALVGFYAALAPTLLANQLHITNHAIAGAVFLELAIVVAGAIIATQRIASRTAMLAALALMLPSVATLVAAQLEKSLAILIIATAICAVASGLGYRGSLQVANQIAPPDRRAELVSSYLICAFIGNALPVIGVGVVSTLAGPVTASLAFAVTIAIFALVALAFDMRNQTM
ncbi:MFS transporter [Bradyrhizobium sp. Tv2a-2]|uniref:MFS transporter n=1 Tax=Bradyrhizobium sp. Tv2a-2 TaxID=113395 RepID=UPI00042167E8|nr:MFS transporter [Bradyrhizobium sp. Tv2a-2]